MLKEAKNFRIVLKGNRESVTYKKSLIDCSTSFRELLKWDFNLNKLSRKLVVVVSKTVKQAFFLGDSSETLSEVSLTKMTRFKWELINFNSIVKVFL